jgi:protein-L-isoaspartate O-methyltransferase
VRRERLDRDYFENLYEESTDPWGFETSEYERRKYERTLESLGERRFRRAFEAGSSIGVFTAMLAPRCDELLAADTSERAVEIARRRLAKHPHVRVERRTLPEEMPEGPFDLIVVSEVCTTGRGRSCSRRCAALKESLRREASSSPSTGARRPGPTRCKVTRCTSCS